MVAISMYRGNLHRPPDVPRRWLMPTRELSLKDFRSLLRRRTRALSRLRFSSSSSNPSTTLPASTHSIECPKPNGSAHEVLLDEEKRDSSKEEPAAVAAEEVKEQQPGSGSGNCLENLVDRPDLKPDGAVDSNDCTDVSLLTPEKPDEEAKQIVETAEKKDALDDKKRKRKDVEEKLQVLNAKKHNLVQVLKQILNVEEELKRRNSSQCMASRPAAPLQAEATNDSGSMTMHTPRIGSEANLATDNEVGIADVLNQSVHSRHVLRMSSMSPSSDSPLRRPSHIQYNVVPHPSRATLGISVSPSRFAPTANPAQPGNPSSVSVSGTNYVASSPSPAASGGTSVFRDARQPSPWN